MSFGSLRFVQESQVWYRFVGNLDERAILPVLEKEPICLDLGELKSINSLGISQWIKWTETAPSIRLFKVPYFLIRQFTMVKGMLRPGLRVESVTLPFFCETCQKNASLPLDRAELERYKTEKDAVFTVAKLTECTQIPCGLEPDFMPGTMFDKLVGE